MTAAALLRAERAGKTYRSRRGLFRPAREHRAFGPVDLEWRAGECAALVGRSGSGKSSLARCLAGHEPLTEGALSGTAVQGGSVRGVQLVFQDSPLALNPRWSVAEILEEPARVCGRRESRTFLGRRLEEAGLPADLLDRRPQQLSGGQRQRVAIARALAAHPLHALILDEPFAGLDSASAEHIQVLLWSLAVKRGLAVLWITHDLKRVCEAPGDVLAMEQGRIVERLSAREFAAAARHPASRALIDAMLPGPPP
jgi:ABC-type dipeptide/oligopeptide/nickel transport system ATPase subunit